LQGDSALFSGVAYSRIYCLNEQVGIWGADENLLAVLEYQLQPLVAADIVCLAAKETAANSPPAILGDRAVLTGVIVFNVMIKQQSVLDMKREKPEINTLIANPGFKLAHPQQNRNYYQYREGDRNPCDNQRPGAMSIRRYKIKKQQNSDKSYRNQSKQVMQKAIFLPFAENQLIFSSHINFLQINKPAMPITLPPLFNIRV
jgi:hypothetical protein